jgi:hypothetical protein
VDFMTRQELVRLARFRGMVLEGDAEHPEYLALSSGEARCYWSTSFETQDRFSELCRLWRTMFDSVGLQWPLYATEIHRSIVSCSDPVAAAALGAMDLPEDESFVAIITEADRPAADMLLSAVVEAVERENLNALVFSAAFDRFMMIDHHYCIFSFFANEREKARAVAAMSRAGFALPKEPPDCTFKFGPDGAPIENTGDSLEQEP